MNLKTALIQEQIIKTIRDFFYAQNFHEAIIPILNMSLPLEPNVYAFVTTWQTHHETKNYYLSTSPESALKKMMAAGIGNCFAFSKSFRNLEDSGKQHSPEFLMLEWYRENADYHQIMKDVHKLILYINKGKNHFYYQGKIIQLKNEWPVLSMTYLFKKFADLDLRELIEDEKMKNAALAKGYKIENATWEQLFSQIFLNEIEPNLGFDPCFIIDFPARISLLCKTKKEDTRFAERFEVYLANMEIGNGNTENTDAKNVKDKFIKEKQYRRKTGITSPSIDEKFLEALRIMKNKSYAGVGLGIDRLVMLFADCASIQDVL